jgi:hypothetical protein
LQAAYISWVKTCLLPVKSCWGKYRGKKHMEACTAWGSHRVGVVGLVVHNFNVTYLSHPSQAPGWRKGKTRMWKVPDVEGPGQRLANHQQKMVLYGPHIWDKEASASAFVAHHAWGAACVRVISWAAVGAL